MKRFSIFIAPILIWELSACALEHQAVRAPKEFQRQQEDLIAKIDQQLNEIGRRIDTLIDASEAWHHDEAEFNAQIVELVREKNSVGRKLEYLRAATPDIWPYLKTDMEEAMIDLELLLKEIDKSAGLSYDPQLRR